MSDLWPSQDEVGARATRMFADEDKRNSLENRKKRVNEELEKIVAEQRRQMIDIAVRRGYRACYVGVHKMVPASYDAARHDIMKSDLRFRSVTNGVIRCIREEFYRLQNED